MIVRWIWDQADQKRAFNVTHARYTGAFPGTPALAEAISAGLIAGLAPLEPFLATGTIFHGVDLRDINTANNPIINRTGTSTAAGSSTSLPMPNEMAIVLTERTARTGQSFRGRIFLPGLAANAINSSGLIDAALMTVLANFASGLSGAYSSNGVTQCLALPARAQYTGSTGRVHPARAATTQDVTSTIIRDNHFDSQRRRGLK
jgi:hypothetical protein